MVPVLARFVACVSGALCALACAQPLHAAAFTLKDGELKIFASGLLTDGDRYFDGAGKLKSRGRYRKMDLQVFAEYGLRDGLTVFGSTELEKISAKDGVSHSRDGLGRSEIGLRARVYESGPWIASVQGSAVVAGAKKGEGLAAIGETDDQFDVRGLIARSFELFGKPAFLDVEAGYRWRSGDPADEMRVDATLGVRVAPRWLLLAQSFNTFGMGRWDGPYALRQRIFKVQGAALFDVTQSLIVYVGAFATPHGRDALEETGATIGLGYHF